MIYTKTKENPIPIFIPFFAAQNFQIGQKQFIQSEKYKLIVFNENEMVREQSLHFKSFLIKIAFVYTNIENVSLLSQIYKKKTRTPRTVLYYQIKGIKSKKK